MESIEMPTHRSAAVTSAVARSGGVDVHAVVLQVDEALCRMSGITWLAAQRGDRAAHQLVELSAQARAESWSPDTLVCARMQVLRPRRSEINALGRAYLDELAPGAIDAAHRIRRAGVAVSLSGDVATEALFGVAGALGVTPEDIHAPRLRFDALGAFSSCDPAAAGSSASSRGAMFVGTRRPEAGASYHAHRFVRFTGFVAVDVAATEEERVESFGELTGLVLA